MEFLIVGAIALNLYAIVLVIARALVYRTRLYRPMLFNIGLSIAPIVLLALALAAFALLMTTSRTLAVVAVIAIGIVWLLMLPNSSYLITELNFSHRENDEGVPLWYDIILVISLAMSGVVNTIVNVFIAHLIYSIVRFDDTAGAFFTPSALVALGVVLLLVGLGMYLGRYLRLNSWDVKHPGAFVRKVVSHFRESGNLLACFGFTLTYAVFIGILYFTIAGPIVSGLIALEQARL